MFVPFPGSMLLKENLYIKRGDSYLVLTSASLFPGEGVGLKIRLTRQSSWRHMHWPLLSASLTTRSYTPTVHHQSGYVSVYKHTDIDNFKFDTSIFSVHSSGMSRTEIA